MTTLITEPFISGASQISVPPGGPSAARASFFSQAAKLIRPTIIDTEIYGVGIWNSTRRKHTPIFTNPQKDAPRNVNPWTGRREYHTIGMKNLMEHVSGVRPYFRANVAEERHESWESMGLLRLLDEMYGHDDRMPGPGEEDAFLKVMTSDRPPISPAKARDYQKGKSGKDPMTGDSMLARLKRFLVSSRENTLVYRLLNRAITTKYVPVMEHEYTVDIDGEDGYEKSLTAAHANTLAQRYVDKVFSPAGIATYIEPSRNRGGAYIDFRIRRESDAVEVNELLGHLLARLKQVKHDDLLAHACKIGGKLATWKENHSYDSAATHEWQGGDESRPTAGEDYEWRKCHVDKLNDDGTRVMWAYSSPMESHVLNGIDLITCPLHDLHADADGGRERVARYTEYAAKPATAESVLRSFLGVAAQAEAPTTKTSKIKKKNRAVRSRASAITISGTNDYHAELLKMFGSGQATNITIFLDTTATEHERFGAAARMALRHHHGDVEAAITTTLELVELGAATGEVGPATGPRTAEREDHVRRQGVYWAARYDDTIAGSGNAAWLFGTGETAQENTKDMARRMTGRISQALIDEIECRHPDSAALKRDRIAAAYMVILSNIHTGHLREVPRTSIIAGMKVLGYDISVHTAAALVDLLCDPRVCLLKKIMRTELDEDGDIAREYSHRPGECRMFALDLDALVPAWLIEAGVPIQYDMDMNMTEGAQGPTGHNGTVNTEPSTIHQKTIGEVVMDDDEFGVSLMGAQWVEVDDFEVETEAIPIFS